MNIFQRIIRKLFLVKEIISKQGVVHFRRYRLIQTPWFAVYLHQICKSDEDKDLHDHPWSFESLILKGSYRENYSTGMHHYVVRNKTYYAGDVVQHDAEDAHQLTLLSQEAWTLVFTSGREREWGYRTAMGWVDNKTYRQLKNDGKLI
jgi:hypothetical protein